MAYETETIPQVDFIVRPRNIYVTLAKKIVAGTIGIDMIDGPSEILVIADGSAIPEFTSAVELANTIASEHLELHIKDPFVHIGWIRNAGAVLGVTTLRSRLVIILPDPIMYCPPRVWQDLPLPFPWITSPRRPE